MELKQEINKFFKWFRENGEIYVNLSIENMIDKYLVEQNKVCCCGEFKYADQDICATCSDEQSSLQKFIEGIDNKYFIIFENDDNKLCLTPFRPNTTFSSFLSIPEKFKETLNCVFHNFSAELRGGDGFKFKIYEKEYLLSLIS